MIFGTMLPPILPVPIFLGAKFACNSLAFLQFIASETLSPANCCSLIHTNNIFSTSSIVCDLCFVSTFTSFTTSASLISFFFARMELIVNADFQYILVSSVTRTPLSYFIMSSFVNSIVFLAFFILWPHGGLFSSRTQ